MEFFFRMMNWPQMSVFKFAGPILLGVIFVVILYLHSKKPELTIFTKRLKIRVFIIATIGLIIFFTPTEKLIEMVIMEEKNTELAE